MVGELILKWMKLVMWMWMLAATHAHGVELQAEVRDRMRREGG